MFEDTSINFGVSARLKQDMNPALLRPLAPSTQPAVRPESVPAKSAPVSALPAPESDRPVSDKFQAQVETSPYINEAVLGSRSYLAWLALLSIIPSIIFWFFSLLYVVGVPAPLRIVVTAIPFVLLVILNLTTPVVAIGLAWLAYKKNTADAPARFWAIMVAALAGLCLLACLLWLTLEAI